MVASIKIVKSHLNFIKMCVGLMQLFSQNFLRFSAGNQKNCGGNISRRQMDPKNGISDPRKNSDDLTPGKLKLIHQTFRSVPKMEESSPI